MFIFSIVLVYQIKSLFSQLQLIQQIPQFILSLDICKKLNWVLQLTNMRQKSSRVVNHKSANARAVANAQKSQLAQGLMINSTYNNLVRQLARIVYPSEEISVRANHFQTLQVLKQMRDCLRKELIYYNRSANDRLVKFIAQRKLTNAGNLIGRYEQINDQIDYCKARLQSVKVTDSERQNHQLIDLQKRLSEELKVLNRRRAEVQSRKDMIRQRIQNGEYDLLKRKEELLKEQIKLRSLEQNQKIS